MSSKTRKEQWFCRESVNAFTYLRSWALLEKPPIVQLLKNFSTFYGTRRFITVFTRALHWSLINAFRICIRNVKCNGVAWLSGTSRTSTDRPELFGVHMNRPNFPVRTKIISLQCPRSQKRPLCSMTWTLGACMCISVSYVFVMRPWSGHVLGPVTPAKCLKRIHNATWRLNTGNVQSGKHRRDVHR
jgi:hypothetical protein